MQNDTSKFVRNIIPLQNIQTNVTGLNPVSVVSGQVKNLQSMVNYATKTINTDFIQSFTNGGTIQLISPMNLSNVSLTGNSLIGTTETGVTSDGILTSTVMSFNINSRPVMTIVGSGNLLYYDVSGQATEFRVSSVVLKGDSASFSTLNAGSATFRTVYASNYLTLSDILAKTGIREWRDTIVDKFDKIKPYVFTYKDTSAVNIGLLAQEVEAVYPQCVTQGSDKYVNYDSVVALLLGAVKELSARVAVLERGQSPI